MSTIRWSPTSALLDKNKSEAVGTIVIGSPGSGKSVFLQTACANALGMGQRIIVIDPKNDMKKLTRVYDDIKLVDIENIHPGALNPFTFLDNFDTSTLLTIIELICGKLDSEDIIAITPIIQDFIIAKNRDNTYQDMQSLADYLYSRDNKSSQKIGTMLKAYEDNRFGPLLFTRQDNVKPLLLETSSSIIISLHGMDLPDHSKKPSEYNANERFTSAILYIITSKLLEILSGKNAIPTLLICDEAHLLFSNNEMANVIDRFLRLGRSLNVCTMLASQGVSNFPEGIAQFLASKFIFKSSIDEAELFLDKFDNTKLEQGAIDRDFVISSIAQRSAGEAYMIDYKNRNGFIKIIPTYGLETFV